ncbi:protein S-acyltransferase 21-like isoform X2 [Amborella trichopoda]|uniref:protein S-acyltransferase 21-like isoform X2 n=1 Tax=Amborella trichopoda TaxID=13333 RepID=UPI0009BFCA28|nr:protein S-acyltransferase 21-like isoform X2 [Amborella trichopoda]|eukprot:XP_020530025.1 protein S-acyltransferase 21-like isoform X2 [Amborella trichopoda]
MLFLLHFLGRTYLNMWQWEFTPLWCTAVDPSDPGILMPYDETLACRQQINIVSGKHASNRESRRESRYPQTPTMCSWVSYLNICGLLCGLLVKDDCRKEEEINEQEANEEDALFCTLCNAEVRKFSKHCRSCDKCVDGFDHHCRWLNNCVGRKNYFTFISLMASSLVWLLIEFGVGTAVLVRCFVNRKGTEEQIIDRLGNGFTLAPFATVVAVCTAVSLLATVPLGELFFFHMILIRKGITTYEYVVAMRTQSEPPGPSVDGEQQQSMPSSPTSSAVTAMSGGSSLGLQYKGAWCTPPRVFVDHQDEVIPHLGPGRVPSTVDPDAVGANRPPKRAVRISAWKLAKLDSNEAMRAAAKARASSSVLRPVSSRPHRGSGYSSGNISGASSLRSLDIGPNKEARNNNQSFSPITRSVSSFSSPGHTNEPASLSPLASERPSLSSNAASLSNVVNATFPVGRMMPDAEHYNPIYQSSTGRSTPNRPDSSVTESISEKPGRKSSYTGRDNLTASVVWDQGAGRYTLGPVSNGTDANLEVGVGASNQGMAASEMNSETRPVIGVTHEPGSVFSGGSSSAFSLSTSEAIQERRRGMEGSRAPGSVFSGRGGAPNSSSVFSLSNIGNQNLLYTEQSIFFGGPLLSMDSRGSSLGNGRPEGLGLQRQQGRGGRGRGSSQLPVFVPSDYQDNQFS